MTLGNPRTESVRVLVAEQMSVESLHEFAAKETKDGRPTFFHDARSAEIDSSVLGQPGMHYVYKPGVSSDEITSLCASGTYQGLMVRPKAVSPDVNVQVAVRIGTGTDNLTNWAKGSGRILMNTPGQNASATAEYSVKALMTLRMQRLETVPEGYDHTANKVEATLSSLFHLLAPTRFREASRDTANGTLTSADLSAHLSTEIRGKKIVIDMSNGNEKVGGRLARILKTLRADVEVMNPSWAAITQLQALGIKKVNEPTKDSTIVSRAGEALQITKAGDICTIDETPHTLIAGKTIAVVGMGDIGTEVARIMQAMGATVRGQSRSFSEEEARALTIGHGKSPIDVMTGADAVTIHVPGGAETKSLIGREELAVLNNNAVLVNAARASVVDIAALDEAFKGGKVTGAIIDADRFQAKPDGTPDPRDALQPYLDLQRTHSGILVTPHFGGDVTRETNDRATMQGLQQMNGVFYNRHIVNAKSAIPVGYRDNGVVKPEGIGRPPAHAAMALT